MSDLSYYERNREARLAYQKKYKEEHKEQYNKYHKNYYYKYDKEYAEDYRNKNRDRINQQKKDSYHKCQAKKIEKEKVIFTEIETTKKIEFTGIIIDW